MNKILIKRYVLYLLRWQLSTLILAPCIKYFGHLGYVEATIIANLIGGIIFFWVDRFIFYHKFKTPIWEIQEDSICADCGINCRGYRLVKKAGYDKSEDPQPQFRCESCSTVKFNKMINYT
jgi:hypothetical protein